MTNDTPNSSSPAYAVLLELPAEGILAESGGLNFVLKRPGGSQPEWLQGTGNKDFEIAFPEVGFWSGVLTFHTSQKTLPYACLAHGSLLYAV